VVQTHQMHVVSCVLKHTVLCANMSLNDAVWCFMSRSPAALLQQ
jgi:hypothetical protein